MERSETNFLPSKTLAHFCGEDWGTATGWYMADLYYDRRVRAYDEGGEHPGAVPSPQGRGTLSSESWDESPLRMWVTLQWMVNLEGLRIIRFAVDEILWTGPPGPEDALNRAPGFTLTLNEGKGEWYLPSAPPHPHLIASMKSCLGQLGIAVAVHKSLRDTQALIECLNVEIEQAIAAHDEAVTAANRVTAYERSWGSGGGCYCSGPEHAWNCPVDSKVPRGLSRAERLDEAVTEAIAHSRILHKKRAEAEARYHALKAWE